MATTDTLLGRVFDGRYLIRRRLGAGGMADVYLAEDQELGRSVALKMLNERHAADEQFVERFRREAQNAAGLNHPNIVTIFERGQAEGTYYIAMEFLDGRTLKELLVKNGPPPIPIAIDYARQILSALSFAHRNGIVHRDIKPHNVVVGADGRLKVTDFGIARSGASEMTEVGSIVGTAQYLSPEQAKGAPVDPRSDLYSLGIVLYEMLTGKVPFVGDAPVEIAMKHLRSTADPPSTFRPEMTRDLDAVVMRALAKEPEDRYDSAEEMEADLARVARGAAVSPRTEEALTQVIVRDALVALPAAVPPRALEAPPAAPPDYRTPAPYYGYQEPPRRRSPWPWLLGLLAIVLAAGAGYLVYQWIDDQINKNNPVGVVDVTRVRSPLAKRKLQDEGFRVVVATEASGSVPFGSVIRQVPGGGDVAVKGSTVTIYVSSGKPRTTVPAVKGYTLPLAISTLNAAHLNANPVFIYSSGPANTVVAQDPKAGKIVLYNESVRINISKGIKPLSVPSVVGSPYGTASSALTNDGFVVVRADVDSNAPKGQIVAQDPQAGASESRGTTITLSVSKGPQVAQVPDVTGQAEADAVALLKAAGYKSTAQTTDVSDPASDGLVLSQTPVGGKVTEKGVLVTIVVGHLVTPPPAATTTTVPADTTTTTTAATDGATPPTDTTTPPADTPAPQNDQGAPPLAKSAP
jgi:serine/threonine-protein kinase